MATGVDGGLGWVGFSQLKFARAGVHYEVRLHAPREGEPGCWARLLRKRRAAIPEVVAVRGRLASWHVRVRPCDTRGSLERRAIMRALALLAQARRDAERAEQGGGH